MLRFFVFIQSCHQKSEFHGAPGVVGSFSSFSFRLIGSCVFQCVFFMFLQSKPAVKGSRRVGYQDWTLVSSNAFVTLSFFIDAFTDAAVLSGRLQLSR